MPSMMKIALPALAAASGAYGTLYETQLTASLLANKSASCLQYVCHHDHPECR